MPNVCIFANALERFKSFKSSSQGICQLPESRPVVFFGFLKINVVVVPVPRSSINNALWKRVLFFKIPINQNVIGYWDSCFASQLETKKSKCGAGP